MSNNSSQLSRHSARNFSDKSVDLEQLKEIISEAQHAPSWENAQPWKVYLAVGETAKQIRKANADAVDQQKKSWAEVTPPQEWAAKPQKNIDDWLKRMATYMGDDVQLFGEAGKNLYNAPAIAYITIPKDSTQFSAYDTGAFGYGILLAAEERGISSLPAYSFVRFPEIVRQYFNISEDEVILMGIGLGYPTDAKINKMETVREPLDAALQIRD
ncbi:nitroreductase [Levilactobacillus andaensis]|uniref:nitroreductase n=1 Tax=Levilactobacillus andaensis TaxID=2799570 RepID=UPI0019445FC5|nr:nitroreductase [Levilactobacillus andaensis]